MTTKPKPASREERLYAALAALLKSLTCTADNGLRIAKLVRGSYVGDFSSVLEAERLLEERESS